MYRTIFRSIHDTLINIHVGIVQCICFTLETLLCCMFLKYFRSNYCISLTCFYGLRIGVLVGASEDSKGCPFMVFPLGYKGFFQYICYDSSYITQCTEFVRIFPTNANGWCCQNIDLRLVFQVFPHDLRVPTPFWVVDQRVASLRHWFQKHQLRHSTQCLGSVSWTSSEHGFC